MKKILFAIMIACSFCFINSGKAMAKKVLIEEGYVPLGNGNYMKTVTIQKGKTTDKNLKIITKDTVYDKNGNVVSRHKEVEKPNR